MKLADLKPIGFIPTTNAEAAKTFYKDVLGLEFVSDDGFALVFNSGGIMLRVIRVQGPAFEPQPFGIFGWEAPDMEATVDALAAKGVVFERYGFFEQDARGIWTAPNGNQVAWFKDPEGNTLSVSKH
jgi:catechol 2,3-dioxygenase-like lactoylglutathione lyase family enzyme